MKLPKAPVIAGIVLYLGGVVAMVLQSVIGSFLPAAMLMTVAALCWLQAMLRYKDAYEREKRDARAYKRNFLNLEHRLETTKATLESEVEQWVECALDLSVDLLAANDRTLEMHKLNHPAGKGTPND